MATPPEEWPGPAELQHPNVSARDRLQEKNTRMNFSFRSSSTELWAGTQAELEASLDDWKAFRGQTS